MRDVECWESKTGDQVLRESVMWSLTSVQATGQSSVGLRLPPPDLLLGLVVGRAAA